ncbi:TPA: type IV conjugative transfer system pilin TraA, partial [Escherichia coli]
MNTVLTVQGSSVAVENKKSVLSRIFNKKNVLKA